MEIRRIAAILFAFVGVGAAAFQVALALGAPWGAYAMGGMYPGRFPAALRFSALFQAGLLLVFVALILARAGVAFPGLARAARRAVWVIVAFSAVSFVLNLITPSGGERVIWAPVAFVMLATSFLVAVIKPANAPS